MDRNSKALACLLILLGVALSLAGPGAGDMRAVIAGGRGGLQAAVRQLMVVTPTRLEDVVAPELGVDLELQQRILGGDNSRSNGLEKNKQVCVPKCTDPGEPYTGRDCQKYYKCQG
ncbi:hypothetical protein E2562_039534 [Oryza meyeriana var. granulata]|uniref:Uncharacterized protein n=1 Tax=Oryza meyeriana var. granulata TaxID=110450 RepID=A0A6G1C267_9ORYZ|nr:hypothetical protein E2562_039534 [Oryza meyeriana var. granulata]